MKLHSFRVAGFRAFNDEQTIDLDGTLVIYGGPNGSGKTSIGECLEWLFYGKTLKRSKGDEISKREYAESYRNAHYTRPENPYVEAAIFDDGGISHVIRRELTNSEGSTLSVDGKPSDNLESFGINTLYDRPVILQHTLQDFIYMKPKTRYEVLSAMLGLEPLTAFRNAVEQAKTDLTKCLPRRAIQAQASSDALMRSFEAEPLLKPVSAAIRQGNLTAAKGHLIQIALGRVPAGTQEKDIRPALQAAKAAKERARLDWGRFSLNPVPNPDMHPAITGLDGLDQLYDEYHSHLVSALATVVNSAETSLDPQVRAFLALGLQIHEHEKANVCPFCREETLTPQKIGALREAVEHVLDARPSLSDAQAVLGRLTEAVGRHTQFADRLLPVLPSIEEDQIISDLASDAPRQFENFAEAERTVRTTADAVRSTRAILLDRIRTCSQLFESGKVRDGDSNEIKNAIDAYRDAVKKLPGVANGFSATYAALDPYIRQRLASAQEVRFLALLDDALAKWKDFQIALFTESLSQVLQDVIRQTRQFIEKKQREILGARDKDIRGWYDLMNPGASVGYDSLAPGTDSVELRARSFAKTIMAAPNLSASQLNCIGLAVYLACATRKASPHSMLLFDDPIQSMDDEHTEAFKKVVIKKLLEQGLQVVLLTHMDNFADEVEKLYRTTCNPSFFKMESYSQSGPVVIPTGPHIQGLLIDARKNMDSPNDGYRTQAILALRQFVERFVKDFYVAETGKSVSKRFEDKNWSDLKPLLRQCTKFDSNDESLLEDTHKFTSQHVHTDGTIPAKVPSSARIRPHYDEANNLFSKYKNILGIK